MADEKSPRIERIYLQFLATGVKLSRMKEEMGISCDDYAEMISSFGDGKGLPSRFARYNDISKVMKSYVTLTSWLQENYEAAQPLIEKYDKYGEEEFVEIYREFKRREAA